ncbi:DNA cytosine methyltransferase [Streptomyces polygonati]|uniref:DNA (cytosine-5-)-methyltransferase n=1 Tax=Streptomyces polygonati TaxID=1617087 RepID=A0ABV8HUK8_9ACTN
MYPSKIIDLFAGPGGLDMAATALLIPVIGIEFDADACATRRAADLETEQCDVRHRGPGHFQDARILVGGPPCQTFTVAGNGAGRRALDQVLTLARRMAGGEEIGSLLAGLSDERTGLVLEPLRWALDAIKLEHPYETIVLEQVPAVLPVWKEYKKILEARGYVARCEVLHTEEFGVPQTRRRAILIARLKDANSVSGSGVRLPKPTHHRFHKHGKAQLSVIEDELEPWVTMGQVLGRQAPFEVVSNYGSGGDPKARGRRTHEEPAFTVTGKISRNRVFRTDMKSRGKDDWTRIEDHEAGLLQTFPANYPWSGRAISQQIGNAIPPRLGIHVLAAALDLGEEDVKAALKRLETWEPPILVPSPPESPTL